MRSAVTLLAGAVLGIVGSVALRSLRNQRSRLNPASVPPSTIAMLSGLRPPANPYQRYVDARLAVAEALGNGAGGGDYSDACTLIAALISGIAADLWPGEGKDRKRFVELWSRHASSAIDPNMISVPLLRRWLRENGRIAESEDLAKARPKVFGGGYNSRVVTSAESDMTEAEVQRLCPSLTLRQIRDWSYPVIFYAHVRSPLVHEAHLGDRAAGAPMTERDEVAVSYVNRSGTRQLHFHLPWLIEIARSIAHAAEPSVNPRPLPDPSRWWATP
jgi:hypothetical protein